MQVKKLNLFLNFLLIKKFINKNFKYLFYSFDCILPDYMADETTKELWKNSNFENMTVGFLLRCQNSLHLTSPEMMHFQAWKKLI